MPPPLGQLVRNIPTVAPVPHRSVLSVAGPQASEFLNGLIATSIREGPTRPQFSTFLHAQGRVLYDVFLYSSADLKGENGYLIEYDSRPSKAPPLLALLKRYVLRSKVRIQDASERYDVWAAWNTDARDSKTQIRNWKWARSGVIEPVWDTTSEWPWGVTDEELTDRRAIGMGRRILVRKGDHPRYLANHDLASSEVYTNHRILHGVAEGIDDIPPMQAFPIDSNLDVMGGLDFRKGCYVGQELTVRTYHTGVVRKRILPVTLQSSQVLSSSIHLPVGLDITSAAVKSANGNVPIPRPRGTGKLLTTINGVGLALLRLEQVEGVERNEIQMQLQSQEGHDGAPNWTVSHWWPDWWPREPRNE